MSPQQNFTPLWDSIFYRASVVVELAAKHGTTINATREARAVLEDSQPSLAQDEAVLKTVADRIVTLAAERSVPVEIGDDR